MKLLRCREVGYNCDAIIRGNTEEEIMLNAKNHAIKEHAIKEEDMTPQFKEKIRKLITSDL